MFTEKNFNSENENFSILLQGPELMGVGSLLKKYTALLCTHIGDILPVAASVASTSWRHFAEVACIVEGDFTGTFCFLLVYMVILGDR